MSGLGAQVPPDIPRRSFRPRSGHPERVGRPKRPKPRLPEPRPRDPPSSPTTVPGVDRRSPAGDECRVYRNKSRICQAAAGSHPPPHPEVRSKAEPRRTRIFSAAARSPPHACFEARLWRAPQHEERGAHAMAGLDPAINEERCRCTDRRRHSLGWTWMAGPSPAMTRGEGVRASRLSSGSHLSVTNVALDGCCRCTDRRRHGPWWTWMAGPSPAMTSAPCFETALRAFSA